MGSAVSLRDPPIAPLEPESPFRAGCIEVSALTHVSMPERAGLWLDRQDITSLESTTPPPFLSGFIHGFFSSHNFWKAGSARKGSQSGSSLKRAGVMGVGL